MLFLKKRSLVVANPEPLGHVYGRISDPTQRKGGGLARQMAQDASGFCRQHGFKLAKRVWIDDGVSAFRGLHLSPEHQLGQFLIAAQAGEIPPGDCLLIENWDRLSRQSVWAAMGLVNDLRQLGIHVGRLDRMKLLRCDSTDPGEFFETAIEMMRGNSESTTKSMRRTEAWQLRRKAARENGRLITSCRPAWLEIEAGRFVLNPEAVAAVRRIFTLSAAGYGIAWILRQLEREGIRAIGRTGRWTYGYIGRLLADRRVLGEHQPRTAQKVKAGEVFNGYYPAIVTAEEFAAVRAGCTRRHKQGGRTSEHVNAFARLLRCATDGGTWYITKLMRSAGKGGQRIGHLVLRNTRSQDGSEKGVTFPFLAFERAIVACLKEVDPAELLCGADRTKELREARAAADAVKVELGQAKSFMARSGFSEAIGERIVSLEATARKLESDYAAMADMASEPLSGAWDTARSLLATWDSVNDKQDARIRLRGILRRIVASIHLAVVRRGNDKVAAVQIWFAGSARQRDYVILCRAGKGNSAFRQEGRVLVGSLRPANTSADLDFRRAEDVSAVVDLLSQVSLSELEARLLLLKN